MSNKSSTPALIILFLFPFFVDDEEEGRYYELDGLQFKIINNCSICGVCTKLSKCCPGCPLPFRPPPPSQTNPQVVPSSGSDPRLAVAGSSRTVLAPAPIAQSRPSTSSQNLPGPSRSVNTTTTTTTTDARNVAKPGG